MKSLKNITILVIIVLCFFSKSNGQTDSTVTSMRDSLKKEFELLELQLKFQKKVDSLYHELAVNNDLNKKEKVALQNELNDLKNAGMPTAINVANGEVHLIKAEETGKTLSVVEEGKRNTVESRDARYSGENYAAASSWNLETTENNFDMALMPEVDSVKKTKGYEKSIDTYGKYANERAKTKVSEEKAEQKRNRKYGPPVEEKPASVEYESQVKTEQKSVSTEAEQNVHQTVQYGQARTLGPVMNSGPGGVVSKTAYPNGVFMMYGKPAYNYGGTTYWVQADSYGKHFIFTGQVTIYL